MDRGTVLYVALVVAGVATGLTGSLGVLAAGLVIGPVSQVLGGAALIAFGVHSLRIGAAYPFESDLVALVAVLGAAVAVASFLLRFAGV